MIFKIFHKVITERVKRKMAINASNRNFSKEARSGKRNEEILSDETALRDEILKLKREVMVLRRTNEQNLVKFRKYEDEAKRKDREIEELMDPRKNADVTKVLSTKGAAILMTLKDQNNALIQMVLNKDVQIRRLLAEMKMSKLYASSRKNVSYKEEIARLKNLLLKAQEKLKEYSDKENRARSTRANEGSVFELSSSSEQSSPRDSEEFRLVVRGLEAHLKYSNDLLNKKDQEISLLTDELNFLKKLLQHKTSKNKSFDCHPSGLHKYSFAETHFVPQTRALPPQTPESPNTESKALSSSAPASSTRLPSSNDSLSKHKSLSNIITENDDRKDSEIERTTVATKTDATLLHEIAVGEDSNEGSGTCKLAKEENVGKKILKKRREPKKKIPKKFGKRRRFCENEKRRRSLLALKAPVSEKDEKKGSGQVMLEIFKTMDSEENEGENAKTEEIFPKSENSGFDGRRSSREEVEESEGTQRGGTNSTDDVREEPEVLNSSERSDKDLLTDSLTGGSSENSPGKEENSRKSDAETNSVHFRREIYGQRFDSNSESENGYPTKRQVQRVQVKVQIDSILVKNYGDESGNSTGENSHQREFIETQGDNFAPDDDDNNNDDDDDVITR